MAAPLGNAVNEELMRERTALAMKFHTAYKNIVASDTGRDQTAQAIADLSSEHHHTATTPVSPTRRTKGTKPRATPKKRRLGVGFMEVFDGGVWSPATVVSQNLSGTFTVKVQGRDSPREVVVSPSRLRAAKRRTSVLLPKGASAWTHEGGAGQATTHAVVYPNVADRAETYVETYQPETSVALGPVRQPGRHAIRRPKYYTLERCYEELGKSRTEHAILERENATLKGRIRAVEKQGVYQLDDLLSRAAPLMRVFFTLLGGPNERKSLPQGKVREVEDVYNVMLRALDTSAELRQYCLRGAKCDCYQALGGLQNSGYRVEVTTESSDTDVAVHTAMRFERVSPDNVAGAGDVTPRARPGTTGFVTRAIAAEGGKVYDVQFPWGTMHALSVEKGEVTPLHSPVLWCNAQRLCMPVVNNGHFTALKAELDKAKEGAEDLRRQLEVQRSGQAHSGYAEEVKRISEHIASGKDSAEKGLLAQAKLAELSKKFEDAEEEKRSLARQLNQVSTQCGSELERVQQKLREETTARLLAESHMHLEGQWSCVDSGQIIDDTENKTVKLFEITRSPDHELLFREILPSGEELSGTLRPCRNSDDAPPAVARLAEYKSTLSDGGTLWIGRTDKNKIVRAYRRNAADRVEHVTVATKVLDDTANMPPYIQGVCPRCTHRATPQGTPRVPEKQETPLPTPKQSEANEAGPTADPEEERKLEDLKQALLTKETELQELLRSFEALKNDSAAELADLKEKLNNADHTTPKTLVDPDTRALNKELNMLRDLVDEKDGEIAELKSNSGGVDPDRALKKEVTMLRDLLDERDGEITELKNAGGKPVDSDTRGLKKELDVLRGLLEERDGEISELRGKLSDAPPKTDPDTRALNKELTMLRGLLEERDAEISELRSTPPEEVTKGTPSPPATPAVDQSELNAQKEEIETWQRKAEAALKQVSEKDVLLKKLQSDADASEGMVQQVQDLKGSLSKMQEQLTNAEAVASEEKKVATRLEADATQVQERLQQHKPLALLWKAFYTEKA